MMPSNMNNIKINKKLKGTRQDTKPSLLEQCSKKQEEKINISQF